MIAIALIENNHFNVRMVGFKRDRPSHDSFFGARYTEGSKFLKKEPVMGKMSDYERMFASPTSYMPKMGTSYYRGGVLRQARPYAKRRTYAKRTASYPRKRAYASRPKFGGKKGSRFYYSKYKPKSYYVQGSRANIKRMGKTWRSATKTQQMNRKRLGYYGRGKYGVLGAASNYIGRGAYRNQTSYRRNPFEQPTANGLISGGADTMPRMQHINDETGSLMVSHRERLMDVFAPSDSGFHQDVFTVSPGIEKTFPWLSQIAANYEEYELMQCVFEYDGHSLVGINDTLEVQGSLIMATQMNVKDKPFRDRHEMERFPHASKCAQHGSMVHGVECDPRKIQGDGHRYIRMGGLTKDEDARDFDHAKFTIGQYNTPTELANKEIGQLFVYYTVKLMKPKISSGRGDAISTFRAFCENPDAGRAFGKLGNDAGQTITNGMQIAARNSLPLTPTYGAPAANAQGVMVFTPSNDLTLTFDPYVSGTFRVTVTFGHFGTVTSSTPISAVASGSAVVVKSQLPCTAGNVLLYASGTEAIMIADVQVRPRDLASAQLAAIKITGLDAEDLIKSCIEVTEINILEETSVSDQPELKLIA